MPFESRPFIKWAKSLSGLGCLGIGILWLTVLGPSWRGWLLIVLGVALLVFLDSARWRRSPLEWPLLILSLAAALSPLVTAVPAVTALQLSRFFAAIIGLYGIVVWARTRARFQFLALCLVLLGVGLAVGAPFMVDWNLNKGGFIPPAFYSFLPAVRVEDAVHPNILATLLVLLLPLALAFAFITMPTGKSHGRGWFWLVTAAGLLMGGAFLLTKSRGGYLAMGISILLLIAWYGRRKLAGLLALAMAGIALWLATAVNRPTAGVVQEVTDVGTLAFRQEVWRVALWMLNDFPFTGVGMGTFNQVATQIYPFPPVQHPGAHNLFLQVGVDLGLIGLIAFLALVILVLFMGVRAGQMFSATADRSMWAIVAGSTTGLAGLLLHGLVDNTVWGTRMAFLPWIVMGLITAVYLTTIGKKKAV